MGSFGAVAKAVQVAGRPQRLNPWVTFSGDYVLFQGSQGHVCSMFGALFGLP